jgi:hypothetical protein
VEQTKILASGIRSALIKATMAKNGSARLQAFQLQKEIESFLVSLENPNDFTTLEDSENIFNSLSQRLDAINKRLNGSNQ